jgi:mannose-6-phosphate isomerase-like protein (cupin superfamily)
VLDIAKSEAIRVTGGTVYVCHSDEKLSVGFLRLEPHESLAKHNRPVKEWLVQVEGISVVNLYENNELVEAATLKRGDSLLIPAKQFHQHTNAGDAESLTSWHFDGDITEVIAGLRNQN